MEQQSTITGFLSDSHILNSMPTAVGVYDMNGVIQRYNEQAVQLWGWRPQLVI